jgi:CHAT domain-containing protein
MTILEKAYNIISEVQTQRGEQLSRYFEIKGNLFQERSIETQQIVKFKEQKIEYLFTAVQWYVNALDALSSSDTSVDISTIKIEDCLSLNDCLALLQQTGDAYRELALLEEKDNKGFHQNYLIRALEYYDAASRLTQQARREISSDESKIQLANIEYRTFTKTIETSFSAYAATQNKKYLEKAFRNAEQLKSSSVFDKLSNSLAQENSLIPDSLIQKEKKLNSIISTFKQKVFEEKKYSNTDSVLLEQYNQNIFEATKQRDELNRYLETEYTDYYKLKYSTSMLTIEEIQRQMNENEAIIEYVIVEPEQISRKLEKDTIAYLFTFIITKDQELFSRVEINNSFKSAIESVFNFTSNSNYLFTKNDDSKAFCAASHTLFTTLFAPYEKELQNKNLVVIPDAQLNYISFDGLLQRLPDTSRAVNFAQLDYLIGNYNISYANSANILFTNRNTPKKINNKVLAFAPEYNAEQFELSNARYTLMPLPGVQKEVDAIAKTIKTKIFRGNEATEQNFRENCSDFDILHLAMHAYINDSLPAFSRLAFSPKLQSDALDADGWLNTTDIYNLDLNARMAVLSACNTGVGRLKRGEGMMSLARGFLYAGCPSVVMSLWEVEDQSGTKIMSEFYRNLKKGKTKDEALRLAKLTYLEESNSRLAHPHYWMSFKAIGDNSSIYTSYDVYFFVLLILLIFAFSIDQILRLRKIQKQKKATLD